MPVLWAVKKKSGLLHAVSLLDPQERWEYVLNICVVPYLLPFERIGLPGWQRLAIAMHTAAGDRSHVNSEHIDVCAQSCSVGGALWVGSQAPTPGSGLPSVLGHLGLWGFTVSFKPLSAPLTASGALKNKQFQSKLLKPPPLPRLLCKSTNKNRLRFHLRSPFTFWDSKWAIEIKQAFHKPAVFST